MNKIKKLTLIALIVVLAILLIAVLIGSLLKTHKPAFLYRLFVSQETAPYYLVYVNTGATTGMSYYGQIVKEEREFLILENPGYLNVQAAEKEGEQPQVSFRQMKDDPLKPLPEMKIYKNNIIFVQELSADSPVIAAYKNAK